MRKKQFLFIFILLFFTIFTNNSFALTFNQYTYNPDNIDFNNIKVPTTIYNYTKELGFVKEYNRLWFSFQS